MTYVEAEKYESPLLPEHIREGLRDYIELGRLPGHFLTAMLSNDLSEAVARADSICRPMMADIIVWLYNEAPSASWGSPVRVQAWAKARQEEGE